MKRTITVEAAADHRRLTVGELRQWLAAIDGLPDDTVIKARVAFSGHLRSVTAEEG